MKCNKIINVFSVWWIICSIGINLIVCELGNPYQILGVDRKASTQDIRRAYKQLAKEWHPDKSSDPEAETKFVEIKKAYELLSDTNRRSAFDNHGITHEDAQMNKMKFKFDYSSYERHSSDPFEEFFGHHFHFDQDISIFHKLSITSKYYESHILPKSYYTPHILMFYNDWCFSCMKAAGSFKKMIDSLEPLGTIFATVNSNHESTLVRKTGVHAIPCIVLVLDGKNYVYKDSVFTMHKVVDFVRQKFPYKLIANIRDTNVDSFLAGWLDNRVRCLVIEPRTQPRLRYLIAAYHFRHRVVFGFVQLNLKDTMNIQARYTIHPSLDTVLLFNEDPTRPVASVSMADIPTQTLNNVISSNRYLALPRLSSQEILEGICPAEWNRPRKRLCVILVTENTETHNDARDALRKFALASPYSTDRVRFAYIYQEKQSDFVDALAQDGEETLLRLVIIWRRDTSHVKFEWVNDASMELKRSDNESEEVNYNATKQKLDTTIQRLLRTSEALSFEAEVGDLMDEHAQGLIAKIVNKMFIAYDYFTDNVGQEVILPILSVIASILFVVAVGYAMAYFVRMEEEEIQKKKSNTSTSSNGNSKITAGYTPELKLHELRVENFNALIRCLKPGCRTVLLITDLKSRAKLIPGFHKAVWPYRKNKSLMFSHMLIEKGQTWYAELLRLSLSESKDLQINPRNCVGTVIALNGHRKYFCVYHAKHPESVKGAKRMMKMTKHLSASSKDPEAGAFIGMESDSEDGISDTGSYEPKILLEENLLDGLSNWLDRLFEGTTHRYYINYWPEFTTK